MTLDSPIMPHVHTKVFVKVGRLVEKFKRGDLHTETHRHVAEHSRTIQRSLNKSKLKAMRNLTCLIPFLVLQPSWGLAPAKIPIQTNATAPKMCSH